MTSSTITSTIQPSISPSITGGDSVDPILDPNNADLAFMYTMDARVGATLTDASLNGVDGTIVGAVTVPGHIGDALNFAADAEYVDTTYVYPGGDVTYSFWVSLDDLVQDLRLMVQDYPLDGSGTTTRFSMGYQKSTGVVFFQGNNYQLNVTLDAALSAGVFYHMRAELDASTGVIKLWMDDVEQTTTTPVLSYPEPQGAGANSSYLGEAQYIATTRGLNGDIDQFRWFTRLLTLAEGTTLSKEGV